MPIASVQSNPKVKPADIPLEKLAASKSLNEAQKTHEAARQFEAVLLRQILSDAQKPAIQSRFNMTGVSNSIYQDMMVNQMADQISSAHTLGLSQQLEAQMTRQAKGVAHTAPGAHPQSFTKQSQMKHAADPTVHPTKAPRL